jgi:siroheme synthase
VLLMAVPNRSSVAQRLLHLGRPPGTAVAYVERAATARQQVIRCTLRELALPGSSPGVANPAVMDTTLMAASTSPGLVPSADAAWDWSEQAAD